MQLINGKQSRAVKCVVYGTEGIGKTTFASNFPLPVFIDTEGGTAQMDITRTPAPTSWTMLLQQVDFIINNPAICKTLVIDTADWAEKLLINQFCATKKINGIEDMPYGKGWVYVADEFGKFLNRLNDVIERGINVVLTAHAQMRKFEQPDELGAYDRWELKLGKKTAPMVKEWADLVLFANYETHAIKVDDNKYKAQGGKRVMHTTHNPCWDAKNRHGLPDKLDFDFAQIAHAIPSSGVAPIKEAPATPLEEIKAKIDSFVEVEDEKDLPFTPAPSPAGADNSNLPPALAELMAINGITQAEISGVVAAEGYFPANTPIENYGAEFINGWLIAYWSTIEQNILKNRKDK